MKETLTERMRHAAAHVELYDQEWEAKQLRDGATEIDRLCAAIREGFAGFRNDGSAPPRMQRLMDALAHND